MCSINLKTKCNEKKKKKLEHGFFLKNNLTITLKGKT
jgi:hypothetical protein